MSDAKRLKALEDENAKLKKLLAEAMLDNAMLKDVASKMVTPAAKREATARGTRHPLIGQAARIGGIAGDDQLTL